MIDPDRLFTLCENVKFAVVAYYAGVGRPMPARQYVANGDQQVAFDCEQFTVAPQVVAPRGGALLGFENSPLSRDPAHTMRVATLGLTLVRCAPSIGEDDGQLVPPSPAEEETNARLVLADGQTMFNGLLEAVRLGTLPGCAQIAYLESTTPGSEGRFAATKLRVMIGME